MPAAHEAARRVQACLVCGAAPPYEHVFTRGPYTLVRCPSCTLVFQDPHPGDDALAETYYHDEAWTAEILTSLRDAMAERAGTFQGLLDATGLRPPGRALDVGCSSGAWIARAQEAGWTASGVEIGAATAAAARDAGLDVHTGTLQSYAETAEPGTFDLITFWDVLEHVHDPHADLTIAHRLLRPGGHVAAALPNVDGWYPRVTYALIGRRTRHWEYPELPVHLHDFSPTTLARLLDRAGFDVVDARTFATAFSYYRWTSISLAALGGGWRARVLRAAFEALHIVVYPLARLAGRGNAQFVLARRRAEQP